MGEIESVCAIQSLIQLEGNTRSYSRTADFDANVYYNTNFGEIIFGIVHCYANDLGFDKLTAKVTIDLDSEYDDQYHAVFYSGYCDIEFDEDECILTIKGNGTSGRMKGTYKVVLSNFLFH